jgi:hypothetical protein
MWCLIHVKYHALIIGGVTLIIGIGCCIFGGVSDVEMGEVREEDSFEERNSSLFWIEDWERENSSLFWIEDWEREQAFTPPPVDHE